jgi:hypothetical protein
LHIAARSGQEEARFRPCRGRLCVPGREDAPAAFLRPRKPICPQLPPAACKRVFRCGRCPPPAQPNAPMGSAAAVLQQRRFFFLKSILNMHFLQSGGAAHLAGAKQFRPPPGPQELAGGPREKRCQSVTACKPCFRHATAHAESKPSSSVSRTSTLERARPSTGDAARNEAAAHRIKRAAGRG